MLLNRVEQRLVLERPDLVEVGLGLTVECRAPELFEKPLHGRTSDRVLVDDRGPRETRQHAAELRFATTGIAADEERVRLASSRFESAAVVLYLAEKAGKLIPSDMPGEGRPMAERASACPRASGRAKLRRRRQGGLHGQVV